MENTMENITESTGNNPAAADWQEEETKGVGYR